jgi:sulfur carrier protein
MKLQINGEDRDFSSNLSLSSLLEQMGLKADRVAVELNRNIVSRDQWATIVLNEGDQLEIVHFVGGGWCAQSGQCSVSSDQ